jgi:predicted small metal-binding protein
MLFRYSCKDMGLHCPYIVKGETIEQVTEQALAHVRENHADDFNSLKTTAEIEQMRQAISRSTHVVAG